MEEIRWYKPISVLSFSVSVIISIVSIVGMVVLLLTIRNYNSKTISEKETGKIATYDSIIKKEGMDCPVYACDGPSITGESDPVYLPFRYNENGVKVIQESRTTQFTEK